MNAPLVLVCGPAGYGKTTVIREWLQTSREIHPDQFAWLTLDRSDDDLTHFLTYFITTLQHIRPGIGAGLVKLLQSHKPSPIPVLATLLINELSEIPKNFLLVLDDYHLLTSQAIQNFMTFLVDHQPPFMHLVLVTRSDPALPLARLRAHGQLVEIRQEALCFLPSEVAQFVNQTMNLALTPEEVSLLIKKTEGWVSGLQLAAIALQTMQDRSAFFKAFSGEYTFIADYLTDEVLARQPERIRNFMLQTSILERMTAPLCESVSGQSDAQEILEHLIDTNLFIVPLDNQRTWYRYHNLFGDLLRKRLQSTRSEILPELHSRASRWFENNDLLDQAIDHAIAGRDYEQAARLIEGVADRLLRHGEAATLLRWLEALPEEQIEAQPLLVSLYGTASILCARPAHLVVSLMEKMKTTGKLVEFQGEMNMLQALLAVYQGDPPRTIQHAQQALRYLPPERSYFRCLAADALGMGYTLAWDISAATQAFDLVVEIANQSDNVMMGIMALTNLAGLKYVQGELRTAITTCYQILDMANQRIGRQTPMVSKTLFTLGEMLREQGDLETAMNYLLDAAGLMETFSEVGLSIVNLAIARVYMNQHDWQAAQTYITKARQQAQATQPIQMDDRLVETMQARFYIARGQMDPAIQWARKCGFLDRSPEEIFTKASQNTASYEVFQSECLTLVRLLLAQSQSERALQFVALLQELVEKRKNRRRLIEILALKAIALHQEGQPAQAVSALAGALRMAEPEGYLRTFVDEGEAMARLLYQAVEQGISPGYAGRLLTILVEEKQGFKSSSPVVPTTLVEPLSERELEVLRLIAEGLTNNEIAQQLYISLSTVKGHTSNIYGKLNVKNRTQAVAQARSLGLLPQA